MMNNLVISDIMSIFASVNAGVHGNDSMFVDILEKSPKQEVG